MSSYQFHAVPTQGMREEFRSVGVDYFDKWIPMGYLRGGGGKGNTCNLVL